MSILKFHGLNYDLTRSMLADVESNLSHEQFREMNEKADAIIQCTNYASHESKLVALEMFQLGFLAAHVEMVRE